eukprot:m.360981 g.360981  ORF g.360981 m.360981 type:complete len:331 (-) comp19262_c0_seq1:359-1351(-)
MDDRSELARSPDFVSFVGNVSQRKLMVVTPSGEELMWKIYDMGPKSVKTPILFFPPVSGSGRVFFRQLMPLSAAGYRCIAVDYPIVWDVDTFVVSAIKLLDALKLPAVHICGASVGAFLAQKLAEVTHRRPRVLSLFLINGFTDTAVFKSAPPAAVARFLPGFMLRRMLMNNLPSDKVEPEIARSIDFIVDEMELLERAQLASRFVLNVRPAFVQPEDIINQKLPITIMEVNDRSVVSAEVSLQLQKCYPNAKAAQLRSGGNFPYISRADEVNVFLKIHLKPFLGTDQTPTDDADSNEMARLALAQSEPTSDTKDDSAASQQQPAPEVAL